MNYPKVLSFITFFIGCSFHLLHAQEVEKGKVIWEVNRIDMGTILEEQGPQVAEFKFTHNRDSVLVIQEVLTDCGCTTAEYTRDSLETGEQGVVKINFDPVSAIGPFSRMIIVKGNLQTVEDTLFIEGVSIPTPQNPLIDYPIKKLDYGFRQRKVNVGEVFTNQPKRKAIELFNFGSQTLYADRVYLNGPDHIGLIGATDSIPPQQRGMIEIAYDGAVLSDLGHFEDQIYLGWRGGDSIPVSILAEVFEYFPPVPKDEMASVPQLTLSTKEIDWGDISDSQVREEEIVLTNRGQEVLQIRKIQGNCKCLSLEMSETTIRPGESQTLKVAFDPRGRKGRDQRNIYVFSTDPINPVQLIVLKSRIE
ncbi:DUF1573 domain-containing protein [Algoriphagus namhaensis]